MGLFHKTVTVAESGLMRGFTDWHCHILPGVDDGVKTLQDSLSLLEAYEAAGVSEVWLTPHIMEDIPNAVCDLKAAMSELQGAWRGRVQLHLASENMLDSLFDRRLESGDLLPLAGRRLLVETSYFNPPMDMDEKLRRIKNKGYFPVLAHPERYMYMDSRRYASLKAAGILFQLNLPSLYGYYGPDVQNRAETLLSGGMYDLVGTDVHREQAFTRLLEAGLGKKIISKLL